MASVTSQLVLTPFSVITTRLHINRGPPISAWQVISSTVKTHNGSWAVLWTGYFSALFQSIPHNLVMFSVYNFSKTCLDSWGFMKTSEGGLAARLMCSILGSYAAIVVTSPIDITRTHRQALISSSSSHQERRSTPLLSSTQSTSPSPSSGIFNSHSTQPRRIPSSLFILKDIYNTFGIRYMYRGATARLLSSTPYTVAMLIGYDYVKLFASKQ